MKHAAGWTLPELMIAMAVAGIVTAEAVPMMQQITQRARLVTSTNALSMALLQARQAAVTKGSSVTFCPGDAVGGCSGDWADGRWIVFTDGDHDGEIDPDDAVLAQGRVRNTVDIDGNGPFHQAVVFVASGMPERISGAFAAGRLRVCEEAAITPNATDLVLAATGRVRLEHHDFDGDCPPP